MSSLMINYCYYYWTDIISQWLVNELMLLLLFCPGWLGIKITLVSIIVINEVMLLVLLLMNWYCSWTNIIFDEVIILLYFFADLMCLFQIEEEAISQLLKKYGAHERSDEHITVERVSGPMAAPLWNLKRSNSSSHTWLKFRSFSFMLDWMP